MNFRIYTVVRTQYLKKWSKFLMTTEKYLTIVTSTATWNIHLQVICISGFISLELKKGLPLLLLNTGSGREEIYIEKIRKLNDGALHSIKIDYSYSVSYFTKLWICSYFWAIFQEISMEVDGCKTSCSIWKDLTYRGVLRVNGPLQVGGMKFKFNDEEFKAVWGHLPPTSNGFYGCIRNFTYNSYFYNLGQPADHYKAYPDCNYGVMQAVTFGIDSNFLVAVLVCIAILISKWKFLFQTLFMFMWGLWNANVISWRLWKMQMFCDVLKMRFYRDFIELRILFRDVF